MRIHVLLTAGLLFLPACGERRRVYVITEGTAPGQLVIEHNNQACPPLQPELRGVEIRIPKSGYLCTSTPMYGGTFSSAFVLQTPSGRKKLEPREEIFNHSTFVYGTGDCTMTGESFFYMPPGSKVTTGADLGKLFEMHHSCEPGIRVQRAPSNSALHPTPTAASFSRELYFSACGWRG